MKNKKFHKAIFMMLVLKHKEIHSFSELLKEINELGIKLKRDMPYAYDHYYFAPLHFPNLVYDDLMLMRDMGYVDEFALTDKGLKKLEEIKNNNTYTDDEGRDRIWKRIWDKLEKEASNVGQVANQ